MLDFYILIRDSPHSGTVRHYDTISPVELFGRANRYNRNKL